MESIADDVGCDAKNGEVRATTGSKSPSGSSPDRLRYNCALVHGAREEVALSDADILHPAHLSSSLIDRAHPLRNGACGVWPRYRPKKL